MMTAARQLRRQRAEEERLFTGQQLRPCRLEPRLTEQMPSSEPEATPRRLLRGPTTQSDQTALIRCAKSRRYGASPSHLAGRGCRTGMAVLACKPMDTVGRCSCCQGRRLRGWPAVRPQPRLSTQQPKTGGPANGLVSDLGSLVFLRAAVVGRELIRPGHCGPSGCRSDRHAARALSQAPVFGGRPRRSCWERNLVEAHASPGGIGNQYSSSCSVAAPSTASSSATSRGYGARRHHPLSRPAGGPAPPAA